MADLISGIYNYCDRWCERCAFTSRCRVFEMEQDDPPTDEERDINNAAFWGKLAATLAETQVMLREKAEEFGIDLDAVSREEIQKEIEERRENVRKQDLVQMATSYAKSVGPVLAGIEDTEGEEAGDLIQVVRWYQFMVAAKLSRGIRAEADLDDEILGDTAAYERDGSIKVALISIDRSIAAWGGLLNDKTWTAVRPVISLLEDLRERTESRFPEARDFVRPGFDEIETVM